MLNQTRPPHRIIIVDSSDDKKPIEEVLKKAQKNTHVPIELVHSNRGTSLQRNIGLDSVNEQITFFMDDDSLLFPDAAERIMFVYEHDPSNAIGGVCAAEALEPPVEILEEKRTGIRDRIKLRISYVRRTIENALFCDPFITIGRNRWSELGCPDILREDNVVRVEYMTGFRMTFRTEVIREHRFTELFEQYGLFEDVDASIRVAETHLIVGANDARIYHNRWKGARSGSHNMGFMQILNRAAVVCRNSGEGSTSRRLLTTYAYYKIAQYAFEATFHRKRDRFRGALAALRELPRFVHAPIASVDQIYSNVRKQYQGWQT